MDMETEMDMDQLTPGGYFSEFSWHRIGEDDEAELDFDRFEGAQLIGTLPEIAEPDDGSVHRGKQEAEFEG
jgi:hypothetical protein